MHSGTKPESPRTTTLRRIPPIAGVVKIGYKSSVKALNLREVGGEEKGVDAILIGLDHNVQWRDPTGDFQKLLENELIKSPVDLVAEEAYSLPTTVAQRLACRLGLPWIDMDMNDEERRRAGIYEDSKKDSLSPLFENGEIVGVVGRYSTHIEEVRENFWISRIFAQRVSTVLAICGSLHLAPLAKKLSKVMCVVREVEVWKQDWYVRRFGTFRTIETEEGEWLFEIRNPKRPG